MRSVRNISNVFTIFDDSGFCLVLYEASFIFPQVEANPRHFVALNDSYCVIVFSDVSNLAYHTGPGLTQ